MIGTVFHAVDDYFYMFRDLILILVIFSFVYEKKVLLTHPLFYWGSVLVSALLFRYLYYALLYFFENKVTIREANDIFPTRYVSWIRPILQLSYALIFGKLLTRGRTFHLFVISLYYISISQMLHVVNYSLSRLWPEDFLSSWNMIFVIRACGILFLSLLLAWLMILLGKALRKSSHPAVLWGSAVSAAIVYAAAAYTGAQIDSIWILGFAYTLICIIAVLFVLLYSEIAWNRQKAQQMLFYKEMEKSSRNYTLELDRTVREVRLFRHEFQSRLLQLKALAEEKNYEELNLRIDSMLEAIPTNEQIVTTGNHDFDVIVNRKLQECKAKGISLQVHVSIPKILPYKAEDLFSLINNIMNNAMEAAAAETDPRIRFNALTVKNYLVLTVRNTCSMDALKNNPELHTTKGNPGFHGYGIPVIKQIAEKYNGSVTFSTDEGFFQVKILLALEENPDV